ncbi:MAG: tryptophan--tRNA ligase [Gammaproteobacteria bacterium]|nr:MAG: tryptophan--tRNA ligase [Gammaproteobacteria bacterium]
MRPTGRLHLGNYHGALRNWVELQYQYECFFFVADWHMLTTGYDETAHLQEHVHEVLIDWLAAGLNPGVATLFIQSHVPEHAELQWLLATIAPLGALERAQALVHSNNRITVADRERLLGFLEGTGVTILPEPQVLLTATPKVPGLDGRKMSKSYGNTIGLREEPEQVAQKLRAMKTDPARVRRTDPGDPDKCPVWDLHQIYSDEATRKWASEGCRSAGIGCLDCKQPVIDKIVEEINGMRRRAQEYEDNPELVRGIVAEGADKAREAARETLDEVRRAMHLRPD